MRKNNSKDVVLNNETGTLNSVYLYMTRVAMFCCPIIAYWEFKTIFKISSIAISVTCFIVRSLTCYINSFRAKGCVLIFM